MPRRLEPLLREQGERHSHPEPIVITTEPWCSPELQVADQERAGVVAAGGRRREDGGVPPILSTPRLRLRPWRESDFAPFAAMNADPAVMEHFPSIPTREESDAMARRITARIEETGWGLWAVEVAGGEPFIGFTGLAVPAFEAHFTPCTEIGWRLARNAWGKGYATEAARAALAFGFGDLGLEEIVSFTAVTNRRSMAVMERLGMRRDGEFDHPRIPEGSPVRRHVLYRLRRNDNA